MNSLVKTLILTLTICSFSVASLAEYVALIKSVGNAELSEASAELTTICDERNKAIGTVVSKLML